MSSLSTLFSIIITTLVCLSTLGVLAGDPFEVTADVVPNKEMETGAGTVTLEFEMEPPEPIDVEVNGRTFQVLKPDGHLLTSEPRMPVLPYRMEMVCIPAGADVSYTLDVREETTLNDIRLMPGPSPAKPLTGVQAFYPDDTSEVLEDTDVYSHDSLYPTKPVSLTDRGFIGRQEVIRAKFFPVRFNPSSNSVNVITKATLTITYTGGQQYRQEETRPIRAMLKKQSVNYHHMLALPLRENIPQPDIKPLANENWYKVTINTSGVYGITPADLQAAGVVTSSIDPRTFQLHNAGGGMLSENVNDPIPPRVEVPLYVKGETDGSFDSGDAILFYGFSYSDRVDDIWTKNYYEDHNVYWLTWGGNNGKRMSTVSLPAGSGSTPLSFHRIIHLEEDKEATEIDSLDHRDQVIWSYSQCGSAPWTNGVGLVKQAGQSNWKDYTLTLKACRTSGSSGLIVMFRVQGVNQFYALYVGDNGNTKIRLSKATPAATKTSIASADLAITTGTTYDLKVIVSGSSIQCYVDNTLYVSTTDSTYGSGGIGVNCDYSSIVQYWDFVCSGTTTTASPFSFSDDFTGYSLRSNGHPTWTDLQGSLSDYTVRIKGSDRVFESNTQCISTSFELGSWDTTKPVKLRAWVKGEYAYNEGDTKHRSVFYLNGNNVYDNIWYDYDVLTAEATVSNAHLNVGTNKLEFDLPGNSGDNWDYQSLDWVEIDLWKDFKVENGYLGFNHSGAVQGSGAHRFAITEFTSNDVTGFRLHNFSFTERITNPTISPDGGKYKYEFTDTNGGGQDRYVIVQAGKELKPEKIEKYVSKGLKSADNVYDYLIITHQGLYNPLDSLNPIVRFANHRSSTGLNVSVVTTQNIYDEFSNGLFDPTAIRNFLHYAYHNWNGTPSYAVFTGDATCVYKLREDRGAFNVPSHLEKVSTSHESTLASDNWLCCVSGNDLLADIIPGRLPVASMQEAEDVVDKIIAYDTLPNTDGWRRDAVFHADDQTEAWEAIFKGTCVYQRDNYLIPNGFQASQEAYRDDLGASACNQMVRDGMNDGCMLLQYNGHGQPNGWDCFHNSDIDGLTNKDKYPFVMSMGCSTGKFDMPTSNSFCEEMVLADEKGGIASWGPSRVAYSTISLYFHDFSNSIFNQGERGIGEQCTSTLNAIGDNYHLYAMTFFGDPAMKWGLPFVDMDLSTEYRFYERSETVKVTVDLGTGFDGPVDVWVRDTSMALLYSTSGTLSSGKFNCQFDLASDAEYGNYRVFAYAYDAPDHEDSLEFVKIKVTTPGCNPHIETDFITCDPVTPAVNDPANITARVENWGTQPTGVFKVKFYEKSVTPENLLGEKDCPSIIRDGTVDVKIPWTPGGSHGYRTIYVVLDPDDVITELDELDNQADSTVHLLAHPTAVCGWDVVTFRNTNITFTGTNSHAPTGTIVSYTWDMDDGNYVFLEEFNYTYSELGEYYVTLTVTDSNGLKGSAYQIVTIENVLPYASFEMSLLKADVQTPVEFNSSSYDGDGEIAQYLWDFGDGTTSNEEDPVHYFQKKGDITIRLTVTDNDAAQANHTQQITINNIGPEAKIGVDKTEFPTGQVVNFTGWASTDPDDPVLGYSWSFGDGGAASGCNVSRSFSTPGSRNVTLFVTDPAGRVDKDHIWVNATNRAPSLTVVVEPGTGTVETEFTITVNATDPDGFIFNIVIELGDGNWLNDTYATHPGVSEFVYIHKFATNRDVTITAYALDNMGLPSEKVDVDIDLENLPPTLDILSEIRAEAGENITLYPRATDVDGEIVMYEIDLNGDGKFDVKTEEPEMTFKYDAPGDYNAVFRVTDNDRAYTEENIKITITEPGGGGGGDDDVKDDDDDDISDPEGLGSTIFLVLLLMIILLVGGALVVVLLLRNKKGKKTEPGTSPQETEAQTPASTIKPGHPVIETQPHPMTSVEQAPPIASEPPKEFQSPQSGLFQPEQPTESFEEEPIIETFEEEAAPEIDWSPEEDVQEVPPAFQETEEPVESLEETDELDDLFMTE